MKPSAVATMPAGSDLPRTRRSITLSPTTAPSRLPMAPTRQIHWVSSCW